jgi:branched-chain amino acid transport system substrate-binding protein
MALAALLLGPPTVLAQVGETVKIAWIDPLSGLMAPVGQNSRKTFQFLQQQFNAKNAAGVKFEIEFIDNKLSASESLNALKIAADHGARYIVQGNGSAVAAALVDAIDKYNERNPGKELVYVNISAIDPDLTNSRCSYWHFRVDADTSMKLEALGAYMADQKDLKRVYLFNQNYSHGQQMSRLAHDVLARRRPDVQIVGDELHPLAQIRDFAPYVAKIKASGADAVVTGNWGSDLTLLIKAAREAGLTAKFYTLYAFIGGTPTAMGSDGAGRVVQVAWSHSNLSGLHASLADNFKQRFNEDFYNPGVYHVYALLSQAMAKAKSIDPLKVAAAMEGLRFESFNGPVEMRSSDHQLQQPLYVSQWQVTDSRNRYDVEGTGYTFVPLRTVDASVASRPTSCRMRRPS